MTGSNFLLEYDDTKILVDCGFFQGSRISDERNGESFLYNSKDIRAAVVTHAHLDHIGRIPRLARFGFSGKIFSTPPTKNLSELMLIDSLGVLEKESKRDKNKEIIYNSEDVSKAVSLWEGKEYGEQFAVDDFKITLRDAGHILGSATAEIEIAGKKFLFSGDLGNSPEQLLNNTEKVFDAHYIIVESTYGDRVHDKKEDSDLKFERVIEDALNKNGVLMIPAFSLERTQVILFEINNLMEEGRIPKAPVFLDSPLSIRATKIYDDSYKYFKDEARKVLLKEYGFFNFPNLHQTLTTEESKQINNVKGPKIIVAGSGMCNGGRIMHHLLRYLPGKNNTLLFISYQAAGSLGRFLAEGAKNVNIFGENIDVAARIESIEGYSSHADMNGLYDFVNNCADCLEKVFVVHGELKPNLFFVQRLRDHMGIDAVSPQYGQSFDIEL